MATTFPTSLQDLDATRGTNGQTLASPNHVTHHTTEDDTIEALQAKVGVDNSAVTTSLDYKLKSTSSVSPGHKHTLTATDFTDVAISGLADGNVLTYSSGTSKWVNASTSAPDASTSVKGVSKLSVAPVSASNPIAVGDNDTRIPTQGENDGLAATTTASSTNKFMTQKDLQIGAELYAADAGASDTYAITLSPAPASYTTGMKITFKANTANTGTATLNVNSLGAKTIVKNVNTTLDSNDILASQFVTVIYDGTNFVMLSPVANGFRGLVGSGATTRDLSTASGTQNIAHGLGVTPKIYNVYGTKLTSNGTMSFAHAMNGTATSINTDTTGGAQNQTATFQLGTSQTAHQEAVITVDSTNIILTWTKTSTPTGTANIVWSAFA